MDTVPSHYSDGDRVIISYRADEGSGWTSLKRKKKGTVHTSNGWPHWWVDTDLHDAGVQWSDLTAIRKENPAPTNTTMR